MIADQPVKSVVVGIDGSRTAEAAAQWGADEALAHDAVLRLLYVVDTNRAITPHVVKAQLAVAEAALQDARAAVEETHSTVRLEAETVEGDPGTTLSEASWSTAVLCVGAPKAAPHGPHDSLAANVATSAHCSVAIVPARQYSVPPQDGWIAALVHSSSDEYDVLQQAMEEAYSRKIPLRVVLEQPCRADGSAAAIEERLINWSSCYPGMDARVVHAKHLTQYVAEHRNLILSVVVGGQYHGEITELVELTRSRPLHDASFAVYVVRPKHL